MFFLLHLTLLFPYVHRLRLAFHYITQLPFLFSLPPSPVEETISLIGKQNETTFYSLFTTFDILSTPVLTRQLHKAPTRPFRLLSRSPFPGA